MSQITRKKSDERKRPYEKPHYRTIELAAEEVLAVGCKMAGSGGPVSPVSCVSSACFAEGS